MCTHCGCSTKKAQVSSIDSDQEVTLVTSKETPEILHLQHALLHGNDLLAQQNRLLLSTHNITCINLMGTPGAGKTKLLEKFIQQSAFNQSPLLVIEGDQQSLNDASRINKAGGVAIQINTGAGCHLDAQMIHEGLHKLPIQKNRLVFIENVGNLVCPALFDLGESLRITMMAITDGEDKPEKYPHMFSQSEIVVINKIDLLPYIEVDLDKIEKTIKIMNPQTIVCRVSAQTGEGVKQLAEAIAHVRQHL